MKKYATRENKLEIFTEDIDLLTDMYPDCTIHNSWIEAIDYLVNKVMDLKKPDKTLLYSCSEAKCPNYQRILQLSRCGECLSLKLVHSLPNEAGIGVRYD